MNRLPMAGEGGDQDPVSRQLRAVATGSHAAFEALYRDTAPAVDRYLAGMGVQGPVAADVLQETYLAVWRDAARHRGEASGFAWILGIARHKLADYRRGDRHIPVEASGEEAATESGGYELARVREMLAHLHPGDRELVQLVFVADMAYGDVARILGVPVGTVKSRVFRLRKILREQEEIHAR